MADYKEEEKKGEYYSLMENIADKIHHDRHSFSSSSDSKDDKKTTTTSMKNKLVYRLFGREKPLHNVPGGGELAQLQETEYSVETRESSPTDLLLKIESFSLLSTHQIRTFESAEFNAGGYTWKVVMNFDKADGVSVYLLAANYSELPVNWEVNAIFTFCVHNQISDKYVCFRGMSRRFNAMKPKWGFTKLISKKNFRDPGNGYIVNDNCVFGAEVFVIKQNEQRINQCLSLLKPTASLSSVNVKRVWKLYPFVHWSSEQFLVGNHKWKVMLYPKGSYVSIYVKCVDLESLQPHQKLMAEVSITINSHSRKFNHWFTDLTSRGFEEFITIDDMRKSLVGLSCILQVQISLRATSALHAPKLI